MKVYYTGGSLGDTYVIVCKLYSIAKNEKILCKHYTEDDAIKPAVSEIYSLMPNIAVEFRDDDEHLGITGQFIHHKLQGEQMTYLPEGNMYNLRLERHPEFELGSVERFGLPDNYVVLQLQSGANPKKIRRVSVEEIDEILKDNEYPIVVIGKDNMDVSRIEHNIIDLRWMTSIKEAINIIKGAKHFYGCLGLLSLVALSHQVYSTLYKPLSLKDKHTYESRIFPIVEWRRYADGITTISFEELVTRLSRY